MSIGIYKIENLINGKIYIGQSIHIEKRWNEHCQISSHSLISQAIQKYGKENFSFQILEITNNLNELNNLESKYIQQFNSLVPNGYNIVLIDQQQHHQFNKYTIEIFDSIIYDIKNTNLSFQDIATKYKLDLSMIYYLNRGEYHYNFNETYPLRQVKDFSKKYYFCIDCGKQIRKKSQRCLECAHKKQYKCEHPNREELKNLIRNKTFVEIGQQYNVNDNTIRKWCKKFNLPFKIQDIKKYNDNEWKKI